MGTIVSLSQIVSYAWFRPSYLTTFIFPFVVSRNSPGMKTAHKFVLHSSEFSEFLCILDCATHLFVILPIFKLAFSTAIRRVALGTSRNNYIWQFRPFKKTSIWNFTMKEVSISPLPLKYIYSYSLVRDKWLTCRCFILSITELHYRVTLNCLVPCQLFAQTYEVHPFDSFNVN